MTVKGKIGEVAFTAGIDRTGEIKHSFWVEISHYACADMTQRIYGQGRGSRELSERELKALLSDLGAVITEQEAIKGEQNA